MQGSHCSYAHAHGHRNAMIQGLNVVLAPSNVGSDSGSALMSAGGDKGVCVAKT